MSTELSKQTLEHAMLMVEALVPLLVRSGIGFGEFAAACKPAFYRQALMEAERTGKKTTDSAISLLSGLHRRDTASLRKAIQQDPSLEHPPVSQPVTVPKQVVARWLASSASDTINLQGKKNSFEAFVKQVSKDQHYRSILDELERIGIVSVNHTDKQATLRRNAFTPDPSAIEAREQLAENVADHISAGITNLFADVDTGDKGVLEQAIFSDELSQASIDKLHDLANELWFNTLNTILTEAIALHETDKQHPDANLRFRLGMYAFHEPQRETNASSD